MCKTLELKKVFLRKSLESFVIGIVRQLRSSSTGRKELFYKITTCIAQEDNCIRTNSPKGKSFFKCYEKIVRNKCQDIVNMQIITILDPVNQPLNLY